MAFDVFCHVLKKHFGSPSKGEPLEAFSIEWDPLRVALPGTREDEHPHLVATCSSVVVTVTDARVGVSGEGRSDFGRWSDLASVEGPRKSISVAEDGSVSAVITPRLELRFRSRSPLVIETREDEAALLFALHGVARWVIIVVGSGRPLADFGLR